MKIKELLNDLFETNKSIPEFLRQDCLGHQTLSHVKDDLLAFDEFKNVEELHLLKIPYAENDLGEVIELQSLKLSEGMEFGKRCYIYSISITPEIYDPTAKFKPVKNGAYITPVSYDETTFKPSRNICIEFSPEELQDDKVLNKENKAQKLRDLFNDILESPNDYMIRGEHNFIIRGIFEEVKIGGETLTKDIGTLNLNYNNHKFFAVYYLATESLDGEVKIKFQKKYLPIEMKDNFEETFKDKSFINEESLEEFLNNFNEKS